ncbi:MAG: insulinase family protein [Chloroflexi bacterium]|nr:insulinase family protein [Chloroflexota bacterium]
MTLHGFDLIHEQDIPELKTRARLFRHAQTGAPLLSLENDDENKVFGIAFRTPPSDSTGVPHIMEHSVLNGSRKYPAKEPFMQLVKGSLKTFVNAITFPDKTVYPVASQNLQDFYNLVDVYLDAVFHPRLNPFTLQQEGWHYELDSLNSPLTFRGVVFNEMKGAYSNADSLLFRTSQQAILPDTPYGVDSGGDPTHIPDLTYARFKAFHDTYYHPSNARIWFYGDDDPDERLRLLDAYLGEFLPLAVHSDIPLQPRFNQPRRVTRGYDAGKEGAAGKRGMVTLNWLLTEPTDPPTTLAFDLLAHILLGTPASPLRKALIDSALGEELAGAGLMGSLQQMAFSTGLKGIAVEDAARVEALILQTLERLAREGFDAEVVEASLNTVEFRLRENNTGAFPRGLSLMFRALTTWLYDADPLALLAFESPLSAVKARVAAGEPVFEDLLRRYFLDNTHRATVILQPDSELRSREDAAEQERLTQTRAAMGEEELKAVVENTRLLKQRQETPDSPEALATIPMLKRSDLDRRHKPIPLAAPDGDGRVLYHDLFTNGIAYLDVGLNLRALPVQHLPYLPLFGRALLEMGTDKEDFVKLALRIGRTTGGFQRAAFTSPTREPGGIAAWAFLRGKATTAHAQDLLDILHDILLTVRLDNQPRFRQMVLQEKARLEAGLIPSGHMVATARLKAQFNEADWAAEQMGGISLGLSLEQVAW